MMPIFTLAVVLAVASRRRERHIIGAQLPTMVATGLVTTAEASWLRTIPARKQAVALASRHGGRPAGAAVRRFACGVVELAYARDRIDRGFGDARLFTLQHEEVLRVSAARIAAGPALQQFRPW